MQQEPEWLKDWTPLEKRAHARLMAVTKEREACTHPLGFGWDDCCKTCGKLVPPMKEPSFW